MGRVRIFSIMSTQLQNYISVENVRLKWQSYFHLVLPSLDNRIRPITSFKFFDASGQAKQATAEVNKQNSPEQDSN